MIFTSFTHLIYVWFTRHSCDLLVLFWEHCFEYLDKFTDWWEMGVYQNKNYVVGMMYLQTVSYSVCLAGSKLYCTLRVDYLLPKYSSTCFKFPRVASLHAMVWCWLNVIKYESYDFAHFKLYENTLFWNKNFDMPQHTISMFSVFHQ